MVYKISAPAHLYVELEIVQNHTFSSLEKAERAVEKVLSKANITYKKDGRSYKNNSEGTLLEIIELN